MFFLLLSLGRVGAHSLIRLVSLIYSLWRGRNFTAAMAAVPLHFGLLPIKKFHALWPQWLLCPIHICPALYYHYFTIVPVPYFCHSRMRHWCLNQFWFAIGQTLHKQHVVSSISTLVWTAENRYHNISYTILLPTNRETSSNSSEGQRYRLPVAWSSKAN